MLVLELLGTLSLRSDTRPVPLAAQQKRRLGLLAILGLGGRQGLSRDRLEAYLWPESSGELARHALDQTVYAIRHALGSNFLLSTGRELRLNPELIRVDVWEFEEAIRARDSTTAAGIYRGTLLEGFHFADSRELESWIDTERARLRLEYQTAIELLANNSAEAGDHSQCVTWWRKLANSDPLSAGATKKLMLALAASGDRAGAVKHARHYQELVRQELEIEPDSEIERLASTFGHPAITETAGIAARRGPPTIEPSPPSDTPIPMRREGGLSETGFHDVSSGNPLRTRRSRMAAIASFSILVVLLIGAVTMENRQSRDPRPSLADNTARRASRISQPAARESYLRGLNAWNERSKESLDTAVVYFRRATELDPEYAEAYAGLADAYVMIGYYGYRPSEAMYPKAKAAALRSMQLDSTLASAHAALAEELIGERDFAHAESEFRKAIELDPTYPTAHHWYATLLVILGRMPEAVVESRRAADLDPLSLKIQATYGIFLNGSGKHAAALHQFQKVVSEEPDSGWVSRDPWLLQEMSRVYLDNGQYSNAIRTIDRALKIVPRHPHALYTLALIYDQMGRREMARSAFARADTSNESYAADRAMLYAGEGNADSAFLWFDHVKKWGILAMIALQGNRHIDQVRGDPRFRALLMRLGIPSPRETRIVLPAARDAYLRGLNAWSDGSKEGLDTAVVYFRRATELDPEYAEAYAGLADAYVMLGYFGYRPSGTVFPSAKVAALRSLQLDSTLASAHPALAYELTWERDFVAADSEFRKAVAFDPTYATAKALAFDPTYATAHQWYAILLMILGQKPEAVVESPRPANQYPLSLSVPVIEVTFTKWMDDFPALVGFTSYGPGTIAGEVLSRIDDGVFTHLIARYEVTDPSGMHSFKTVIQGKGNDKTGRFELNGIVAWGWMTGALVRVTFRRIAPCNFGTRNLCFQGTIQIQRR